MTARYSLRKLAEDDLEEIWLYTFERWGIGQADEYLRALLSRFAWIADQPLIGKRRDDIKAGYYCFPEGRRVVFYTVRDDGIDIIGIVHGGMDTIEHFDAD